MKRRLILCTVFPVLAGCGASTGPGTLPSGAATTVTVVEEFARLDLLTGIVLAPVANAAADGLSGADTARMEAALASGLEREGLLAAGTRPQTALLSLEVIGVGDGGTAVAVTVRMTVQDRHNWLILGRADVVGRGPRGDVRAAALAAVEAIVELVASKMKKAP